MAGGFVLVFCILVLLNSVSYADMYAIEEKIKLLTELCSDNYPYTYFICLRLCSHDLNSTCFDDQLCFCPSNELINQRIGESNKGKVYQSASLNVFLGTQSNVYCHISDFCEDLCKNDENLNDLLENNERRMVIGALCKLSKSINDDEVQSCVCGIS